MMSARTRGSQADARMIDVDDKYTQSDTETISVNVPIKPTIRDSQPNQLHNSEGVVIRRILVIRKQKLATQVVP